VSATLTFLGAAGTVTGAKFLLETGRVRVLLECGLFQGLRELKARNWSAPPVAPPSLGAVLLSHAHIDHSGYLPRLVRDGFAGPIYCAPGTADLLRIMLPDAARLQEEEAEFRNRERRTRHQPALPLFTTEDAARALAALTTVPFGERFTPGAEVSARFAPSGHILGASVVEVDLAGSRLVYSGDLGRYDVPIMRDPVTIREADTLLVESTYGNRLHEEGDGRAVVEAAVRRAVAEGGALLIPAFAIGRTQELLYALRELEAAGRIPPVAVHLDSPMAIEATAIYARHPEEHDAELARVTAAGIEPFAPSRFYLSRTPDDSKRLNAIEGPVIIIAGSGMATGGRILHHFRQRLSDPRTTVLFVGYQAAGTRGRLLRDGASQLRIFGEEGAVRAAIMATDAMSAHADQGEILRWLGGFRRAPRVTYCVHGEPQAAEALQKEIAARLAWRCAVAGDGEQVRV
jgi:metallo-beta-lactamase family protein